MPPIATTGMSTAATTACSPFRSDDDRLRLGGGGKDGAGPYVRRAGRGGGPRQVGVPRRDADDHRRGGPPHHLAAIPILLPDMYAVGADVQGDVHPVVHDQHRILDKTSHSPAFSRQAV